MMIPKHEVVLCEVNEDKRQNDSKCSKGPVHLGKAVQLRLHPFNEHPEGLMGEKQDEEILASGVCLPFYGG